MTVIRMNPSLRTWKTDDEEDTEERIKSVSSVRRVQKYILELEQEYPMPTIQGCKVEIPLTTEEVNFILGFCILRPMNAAVEILMGVVTDCDQDHKNDIAEDLMDAAPIYEGLRTKMVNAIRQRQH